MYKNFSKHLPKTLGGAAAAMLSAGTIGRAQVPVATVHRDSGVMTTRVVVLEGRTDSIQVLAHRIAQERYGSPMWIDLTGQLDSLILSVVGNKLAVMRGGLRPAMSLRSIRAAKGYLGINAQGPYVVLTDSAGTQRYRFFAYQPIISVDLGSPADHAGIEPGDLLVGYNGIDLINHEFNFSEMLVPKKRVDVTVRRGGEVKDFALVVANAPEEVARRRADLDNDKMFGFPMPGSGVITIRRAGEPPRFGGGGERPSVDAGREARLLPTQKPFFFLSPNGLFGASLSNVDEGLARVLRLRKGILVNSVAEDTPAHRAGLLSGDVIVTCNDDSVNTVGELRDRVVHRLADHSVALRSSVSKR
jgi:membrane-associated protease RseP (regulator of RpoE activity)